MQAPGHATDPLHWARELRRREHAGEVLSMLQRINWRAALRHELTPLERATDPSLPKAVRHQLIEQAAVQGGFQC